MIRRILTPTILIRSSIIAASSLGLYKFSQPDRSTFLQSIQTDSNAMKAIRVDEFGDEKKLRFVSHPRPVPKDNEVLLKVEAIGVNPVEVMIRSGKFGDMIEPPYIPGTDVAGVVLEVGAKVKKFKEGDRVYAIKSDSGVYAEYCTAPMDYVSLLNNTLSFSQGAAIGLPYTVAYKALFTRAKCKKGETVFIHGASGAVGQAAIQLARTKGLNVIGTAGTKEGMDIIKSLGAEFVFNHREEGYLEKVKEATKGKGVPVILEMMANKNLEADLGIIAHRGRIVIIGNQGTIPEFNPSLTMGVEADIMGMVVQISTHDEYMKMLNTINQGQGTWLKPNIAKVYPLYQAHQAHKDISEGCGSKGKIILKPKIA